MCKRRLDKHGWATLSIATVAMLFLAIAVIVTMYDHWALQTEYEACVFERIQANPQLITDTEVDVIDAHCRSVTGYKGR